MIRPRAIIACLLACMAMGCQRPESAVVVYTALDQEFSEPLFAPFEKQAGVTVRPKFDTEATKSVGLANLIRVEAKGGRPRCDLFWNNEILNTLRLEREGLLAPMQPSNGGEIPPEFRSPRGTWYGFAARARVLIVNSDLVDEAATPGSLFDLTETEWRGRVGIAKPLFGTTATHAACLFATLGRDRATEFFRQLKANDVQILSGNKQVALDVAAGRLAVGLTDTDDAIVELEKGMPVRIVYLDRDPDQLGTLFIPNTLAAIRGSNVKAAEQLADYLLSSDVEMALAHGPSAQIPLNPAVRARLRVETPATVHAMKVDWSKAVDLWDETARFIAEEFAGDD